MTSGVSTRSKQMSSLPATPFEEWQPVPGDAGFIERLTDVELGRCVQEMVIAILRLAVADLVAEPPWRRGRRLYRERLEMRRIDAEDFLASRYAADLAEMVGISPASLRYQVAHLRPATRQKVAPGARDSR